MQIRLSPCVFYFSVCIRKETVWIYTKDNQFSLFLFPLPILPLFLLRPHDAHLSHSYRERTKDNYVYTTTSTTKNVNSNATDTPYLTSRNQQPEVRNPSQDGTLKGGAVRWMQCSAIPPHTHAWLHALQSSGDRLSFMYSPCHTYNHIHRYWYMPVYTFTCVYIQR